MIKVIEGNIFTTSCQTIVNTINCVGVMGAGIALECRLRYPDMHERYVDLCRSGQIDIGMLWIYKSSERWILNFPTKKHWRYPSKKEYLYSGLEKFVATYKERGIESIAFPLLGSDKGGISPVDSLSIMQEYLSALDIDVEIYKYSPAVSDDLYDATKKWLISKDVDFIARSTNIRKDRINKVLDAMKMQNISQLNQLGGIDGVGIKTLEKLFKFSQGELNGEFVFERQKGLF